MNSIYKVNRARDKEHPKRLTHAGYTLMEVLVTLAIFTFMAGITMVQSPQGFAKIKLNSYIHDTIIAVRQLQIYGSAAGDTASGRILGAGLHIVKGVRGTAVTPFYDKSTSDINSPTPVSNMTYDIGEKANSFHLAYDKYIIVDYICSNVAMSAAPTGDCSATSLDILFIRPSTQGNIFIDAALNASGKRDKSTAYNGSVIVRFRFLGVDDPKCLVFDPVYGVSLYDDNNCLALSLII